jgi:hypothetical protein
MIRFDTVSLSARARSIIDCSTVDVRHCSEVCPSAACVSAANAVCRLIFLREIYYFL